MFTGRDTELRRALAPWLPAEWAAGPVNGLALAVVRAGLRTRAEVVAAVAAWLERPHLAALDEEACAASAGELPAALAERYGLLPCGWAGGEGGPLRVAALDPFNPSLPGVLRLCAGPAELVVADPDEVARLRARFHGPERTGALAEAPREAVELVLDALLDAAVERRASDLHLEGGDAALRVRLRVDGALVEQTPPPPGLAGALRAALKRRAGLEADERTRPLDGRLRHTVGGWPVDFRLSVLPMAGGESLVLRVLDPRIHRGALEDLGMDPPTAGAVRAAAARPHGLFCVAGPTGSGKTTTLHALLRGLDLRELKLLTVEDPVEHLLDGAIQVNVNPAVGLDFPRALRAFLRADPDLLLVGEVRDAETAWMAAQAALAGQRVFTSLHAAGAWAIPARLRDLGVPGWLAGAVLTGLLGQRLVLRPGGGRTGQFEFVEVTPPRAAAIAADAPEEALRAAAG